MVVYIKEAHPQDGGKHAKNGQEGIAISQPKTIEERLGIAATCAAKLELAIPFVVDEMDNRVGEAYAGWPDRLYIVGKDGKIAYKGGPGPGGFKVSEMSTKFSALGAGEK